MTVIHVYSKTISVVPLKLTKSSLLDWKGKLEASKYFICQYLREYVFKLYKYIAAFEFSYEFR